MGSERRDPGFEGRPPGSGHLISATYDRVYLLRYIESHGKAPALFSTVVTTSIDQNIHYFTRSQFCLPPSFQEMSGKKVDMLDEIPCMCLTQHLLSREINLLAHSRQELSR
jgi:hypothetical protein